MKYQYYEVTRDGIPIARFKLKDHALKFINQVFADNKSYAVREVERRSL